MATSITKDMNIQELVNNYPNSIGVFGAYGIGCIGCAMSGYETLEQGLMAHGIPVEQFMADLNKTLDLA